MKTISAAFQAHLQQETTALAVCWKIVRDDGTVLGFTNHNADVTLDADGAGAVAYQAATGYNRSAIASELGLATGTLEVAGLLDDAAITGADLLAGKYLHAEIKIFLVVWTNLSYGILKMRRGRIGQITLHRDTYIAELIDLKGAYEQIIGEMYTPDCRADLGDSRCGVVLAPAVWAPNRAYAVGDRVMALGGAQPLLHFRCTTAGTSGGTEPAWNTTLDGTTGDASIIWTTLLAFTINCTVAALVAAVGGDVAVQRFTVTPSLSLFTPMPIIGSPFFAGGLVTWGTGNNAGLKGEVKTVEIPSSIVTLLLPPSGPIQVGDTLTLTAGCDKARRTCISKFSNIVRFRGEPFVPGLDTALRFPDSHPMT